MTERTQRVLLATLADIASGRVATSLPAEERHIAIQATAREALNKWKAEAAPATTAR